MTRPHVAADEVDVGRSLVGDDGRGGRALIADVDDGAGRGGAETWRSGDVEKCTAWIRAR